MRARLSKLRKFLVSLDIDQNNTLEIFALKRNNLSEISEKLLKDIFSEFDGSKTIDSISYKVKSWWTASWWHISNIPYKEYEGGIYTIQVNQALNKCFLVVFNESWGKGRGCEYQKVFDCWLCMSSAWFYACTWMKLFQVQRLLLT